VPLGFVLMQARRPGAETAAATRALHNFSIVGMVAVAAVLAGGVLDAYSRLGSLDAFVTTTWGQILACKIGLVLAMVAAALVNRFMLMPRLVARTEATMACLVRSIAFEQATAVLVLAAAALLGILTPPH
jgi:putative copper export protein